MKILGYHRDLSWIAGNAGQHHGTGISEILPAVRGGTELVYKLEYFEGNSCDLW
jgi:hypothetical protein